MKKIITLFAVVAISVMSAQQKVASEVAKRHAANVDFKHVSLLEVSNQAADAEIARAVTKSTLAQIKPAALNEIYTNKYDAIELEIPYLGSVVLVELYKVDIYSDNFHVDTNKSVNEAYTKGLHYRGIIKNDPSSLASVNIFNDEINGIISGDDHNNLIFGKLERNNNVSDYIIYSDMDLRVPSGFNCHVKDDMSHEEHDHQPQARQQAMTEKCVTMYFEVDHDLYLENNSSVSQTTNWMTSVFNNVQTIYTNDEITIALKSIYIWTDFDPYFGEESYDYLFQFNEVRPVFDGDVGQLVGIDPGGLGGVAVTIDGLCTANNFSYSDVNMSYSTVPTFSWTVQVIAHEMGHLLGSRHTHACVWNGNNTSIDGCGTQAGFTEGNCTMGPIPTVVERGTIMSYCHLIGGVGINFANGFGPQPAAAIINDVESANCLSSDCINTCINTVAMIDVTNVTPTSATITWSDLGEVNSSWEVSVMPLNSAAANWNEVTATSFNTLTSLTPNTFYRARIRPICGGTLANSRERIFATAADWCSGVTITDTGGTLSDYDDMETYVRTLIPTAPNQAVRLQFSEFDLEQDYDYLYLYDGANTSAPELSWGGFTGNFDPGTFVSTATDGSLTLAFTSDQAVTEDGYVAFISCEQSLGTGEFSGIDFTYYPNPAKGIVNIISKTEITKVQVYNPQGRLLHDSAINTLETQVDISAFSTGTYFFKLKFGEREVNFKILKN